MPTGCTRSSSTLPRTGTCERASLPARLAQRPRLQELAVPRTMRRRAATAIRCSAITMLLLSIPSSLPLAVAQTEPERCRRYSYGGLEIDLRDDWAPTDFDPFTFRTKNGAGGEIFFIVWLPLRERTYFLNFDDWTKKALEVERLSAKDGT